MENTVKMLTNFRLPDAMSPALREELASEAHITVLDVGTSFLQMDAAVESFALVSEGLLRVFRADDNGRGITLYTVGPGECCMINVLCLLSQRASAADAMVEEPVRALVYSGANFRRWMAEHASMRSFVFGLLADRVEGMMALIDEVAFQRMDRRLAAHLLDRSQRGESLEIKVTHETLAANLGTAREVVSRLLKMFERNGSVALGRGCIRILDEEALREPDF